MGVVRINMSVSLDGYGAGPKVDHDHPMGINGERLHRWLFADEGSEDTENSRAVAVDGTRPKDVDQQVMRELRETTGAVVIGRLTYEIGVGLWGDTPYPVPTFVLTHEPHERVQMRSASFTFVTEGAARAVELARAAAGDRDVLVMGGIGAARSVLRAGLVDEIQLQVIPVLLGAGTRLLDDLGQDPVELEQIGVRASADVLHLRYQVHQGPR